MADQLVRSRASKPKVRTGCLTCKIRHVKCDEGKPHCQRCTTTGRVCDGYLTNLTRRARNSTSPPDTSALGLSQPTFDVPGEFLERQSFHYFQNRTSPALAGYYKNSFWDTFLLQAAHEDVAVKHAVVALGATHQFLHSGLKSDESFAIRNYDKSIKTLLHQQSKGETSTENGLAASILYAFFEIFRGDAGTALKHMTGGLSVYYDNKFKSKAITEEGKTPISMEQLSTVLSHLDIQATELTGPLVHHEILYSSAEYMDTLPHVPDSFATLEEAKCCFVELEKLDLHFHVSISMGLQDGWHQGNTVAKRRDYKLLYDRWLSAFTLFFANNASTMDSNGMKGAVVLKIHHKLMRMSSEIDPNEFDMVMGYDAYEADQEAIVSMAESLLSSSTPGELVHTTDLGLNAPLYVVAVRCRNPSIRRRAIRLLKEYPRMEGIWDGTLAGWVAEWTMQIEEEGLVVNCAADLPDWARVSQTRIAFPGEKTAVLDLIKGRTTETGMLYRRTYKW